MTQTEKSSRKVISGVAWSNPLTHDYRVDQAAHVHVFSVVGGVYTELVQGVDYSVTNIGLDAGYAVTITNAGAWAPDEWVLDARPEIDQASNLSVGGQFGTAFEASIDKLTRRVQRVYDLARRGLKTSLGDAVGDNLYTLPTPAADKLLGWNSAGDDLENFDPTGIGIALVDNDTALTADSATRAPSQHAVKTYVDAFKALFTSFALTLAAAATFAEAWLVLKLNGSLSTRALIKALTPSVGMSVLLTESGRTGNFIWTLGDFSALVAIDTQEGWFLKANGVAANVGAWVREDDTGMFPVRKFGAVADNGATISLPAIQCAIDVAMAMGGGLVMLSGGPGYYRTNGPIVIDYSGAYYAGNRFGKKVKLVGHGSTSTAIVPDAGPYAALYVKGNATDNASYFNMEGIRLSGAVLTAGSIGLLTDKASYVVLDDVIIETFDTGWSATDVEQIGVYNTEIRYNNYGVGGATGTMTSPNSWSFYNSLVAGNFKGGLDLTNVNAFNWNGGSIQYNGYIGDAASFGIKLSEIGNGYGTAGFTNMVFEGNGGLGDFVNGQTAHPCRVSFQNVGFMRTVSFNIATATGAANNGSGAIRLAVSSTAALVGRAKVAVTGVVGTTEANSATPWSFTIIDGTHIDLTGSTFTNAYVSGGKVTIVGFGTNNILMDGSAAGAVVSIRDCEFKSGTGYLPLAGRPTIALSNANAKIVDDGSNDFQNATEKLTYSEAQKIGDDGSAWTIFTPAVSAAGGTFTATATGRYRRVGKRVDFALKITTTSYTATPTAPLTATLPLPAAADTVVAAINMTTTDGTSGIIGSGLSNVRMWRGGIFPITANGQVMAVSGSYETN